MNFATDFGTVRVFSRRLSEQGIFGFAIGRAAQGMRFVIKIQFPDCVYSVFDQLMNEADK